jgi:hypothetical protein
MDDRLKAKLERWHERIEQLKAAEHACLLLDANEKALYSQLLLKAEGRTVAEREAQAYASDDWQNFAKGLAEARSTYNHARRMLDLAQAAFQAEYLEAKHDYDAIRKAGAA